MTTKRIGLSLAAAAVLAAIAAPGVFAAAPDAEGWITLFNGKDLTGWENARQPGGEVKWLVEDGALTNQPHGNDIATKEQWKDFELKLEWKTVPKGNSGVYLRGRTEIQVLDSFGVEKPDVGDNGAIYAQFAPKVNASKPAGEWNTLEAKIVGDRVWVTLNGQVIHEAQQLTEVTGGAVPGKVTDAGPLLLQGDHGKVWYRNIKVRPVVGKEPKPKRSGARE